jgi:hypothetical protein
MRAHTVRKKHVILNHDMPRQRHLIREDIVIPNHTIMRNMHADHKKVARADPRSLPLAVGPVKSAKLANDVVVANFEETFFPFEFNVLRLAANHGMLENAVTGAQTRKLFDHRISRNLAIWANFDVVLDYSGRMDTHLQGFEDNRVLWIVQILFMMLDGLMCLEDEETK